MSWIPKPVTIFLTFFSACCLLLAIAGIPANAASTNNTGSAGPDFTLLQISPLSGDTPGPVPHNLSIPGGTMGPAFPPAPSFVSGNGISTAMVRIENSTEDFLSLFFGLSAISLVASTYVPVDEGRSSEYAVVAFRNLDEASGPKGGGSMSAHGIHRAIQADRWSGDEHGDLLAATVAGGEARDVPVPATLWLMGSALLGLGLFMNHKKTPSA